MSSAMTDMRLDYVSIPSYATQIDVQKGTASPKVAATVPKSEYSSVSSPSPTQTPQTPTKQPFNIPSAILATGITMPSPSPRVSRNAPNLLSTREALSLPTTTAHFRRFAAKSGPLWWVQDRVEEVLMWKKGWKVTTAWMAAYAFVCYFPRLVVLIPHVILLTILFSAHSTYNPTPAREVDAPSRPPYTQPAEGSPEWFSNLQAIQNLMGVVGDTHDLVLHTVVPHLTFSTPYSYTILAFTLLSFFALLLILPLIPLRPLFLVMGLMPFFLTHPFTQTYLPPFLSSYRKCVQMRITRLVDNDRLEDHHLKSVLREVELWENERYGPISGGGSGFGKAQLKTGERKGWTRGRDGWSQLDAEGNGDVSSNLTFELELGWAFVETEDWRKDLEASWTEVDSDDDGWIYTNDTWMNPHNAPLEEWLSTNSGATRRRRWIRRIYRTR